MKNKFAKLGKQASKTSTLSINELTKQVEKTAEEIEREAYTSDAREPFTEEQFLNVWNNLAEKIQAEGTEGCTMVYAAMKTRKPEVKDNFLVEIGVDNKSQLEELNFRKTDLHDYLRKTLSNGGINVTPKVIKDKSQKKAYTDEEKFQKMAENNPALLTLKNELGLDFI